jgi:Fur family zinc uptake transcriptional regulator
MSDHDHHHHGDACAAGTLERAEEVCASRGARLTPIRAKVLQALAASATPVGAYELMDRLAEGGKRPAPITVYRALDFLLTNGLVHRLESRNAYLACDHTHDAHAPVIFLICDSCGEVSEASSDGIADNLAALLAKVEFKARSQLVEVAGECAACQAGRPAA